VSRHRLFVFAAALAVSGLVTAAPASAGLFGSKPKTDASPASGVTPSVSGNTQTSVTTNLPTLSDDGGDDAAFHKASKDEIAAALRADPLTQSAFFTNQFDHAPDDAQMGLYLSNALRALGRYDQAADIAHRVLLFAPDNVDLLLAAARAHIAGDDAFLAVAPLQHVIELKPKDWTAHSLLGVAYQQIKRQDDAQTEWATALKLSPDNPDVLTNIAMSKAAGGDLAGAETLLRTAAAQKDATTQVRQNLALVLGLQGKLPEAERLLRQDLPPQQADANLAWLQQAAAARHAGSAAVAPAASQAPARSWASVQAAGG
jgi:Flp pilus assembly protein TadD